MIRADVTIEIGTRYVYEHEFDPSTYPTVEAALEALKQDIQSGDVSLRGYDVDIGVESIYVESSDLPALREKFDAFDP